MENNIFYQPALEFTQTIFKIGADIGFWKTILDEFVKEHSNDISDNEPLYSTIFSVYEYDLQNQSGHSRKFKDGGVEITSRNLQETKNEFVQWVINSAILHSYNALEILIQNLILNEIIKHRPNNSSTITKYDNNKIKTYYKDYIGKDCNTTNNMHLIEILEHNSEDCKQLFNQKIRVDLNTTWKELFVLLGVLRNTIAHNNMAINTEIQNSIKSKGKDFYLKYFKPLLKSENGMRLEAVHDIFPNVLHFIVEFGINTAKVVKKESDLSFANYY